MDSFFSIWVPVVKPSFISCYKMSVKVFWIGSRPRWRSWMRVRLRPGGRGFDPRRGRQHSFVEIDHEIFSTVILSLPLIQEGQLSVSGQKMCTILVNRIEDYACPVNVWLGKLTALDMTPLGWLGRKTSTQTNFWIGIVHFQKFLTWLHPLLTILHVQVSGYPPGRYFWHA